MTDVGFGVFHLEGSQDLFQQGPWYASQLLSIFGVVLAMGSLAEAQTGACDPACADNELCVDGRCTPCVPACGENELCTSEGCLTEEELAEIWAEAFVEAFFGGGDPDEAVCEPACAEGTVCAEGRCVPQEEPAEADVPVGELDEEADAVVVGSSGSGTTGGPALAGALIGLGGAVGVAVFGGLATASLEAGTDGVEVLGVAAAGLLLAAGIASPLLVDLSRSPTSVGAPGLQFAGWLGFALSGAMAVVMVATWSATPGTLGMTAALGSASLVAFGVDGLITAAGASAGPTAVRSRATVAHLGAARGAFGRLTPTVSLSGRF